MEDERLVKMWQNRRLHGPTRLGAGLMDATTPQAAAYRFDRFTLDLARGALLNEAGAELPLQPKSFALLRSGFQDPTGS
jgi:hypothetical protein